MLFTKKGDLGDTGLYGCDQRISKSSAITEALGVLDETNAFLGLCKVLAEKQYFFFSSEAKQFKKEKKVKISGIIHQVQENLFIIQSQLSGSEKKVLEGEITEIEQIIGEIEKKLPSIKSFFISGGSELSASLDFARTLARRAERRVVAVNEEQLVKVENNTFKYLNRLSSLLYALTRLVNMENGSEEKPPKY